MLSHHEREMMASQRKDQNVTIFTGWASSYQLSILPKWPHYSVILIHMKYKTATEKKTNRLLEQLEEGKGISSLEEDSPKYTLTLVVSTTSSVVINLRIVLLLKLLFVTVQDKSVSIRFST